DLRKARRVLGSPVLIVTHAAGARTERVAFYFVQPPPLEPVAPESTDRRGMLSMARQTRRKTRRINAGYLGTWNQAKKRELVEWQEAIRAAIREAWAVRLLGRLDGGEAPSPRGLERDHSVDQREQRVVASAADAGSRVDAGSPLAHDDRPGAHALPTERLDPEPLGLGVSSVLRGSAALLVCHRAFEGTRRPLFRGFLAGGRGLGVLLVRLRCARGPARGCSFRSRRAQAHLGDLEQGHELPVTLAARVPGLVLVLEDLDLVALLLAEELGRDHGALGLLSVVGRAVVVHDEQRSERHGLADGAVQVLDLDHVARLDLLLFPTRLDDRVHRPDPPHASYVNSTPRPSQVGQVSENDSKSPPETRFRVTSTSPSGPTSKT